MMDMVFINVCLTLFFFANYANGIGVNWGIATSHNLDPKTTAKLLKDNGIDSVKLYGSDASMIKAFAKTGISVMVGIPNGDLKNFSNSINTAKDWVKSNIVKHVKNDGVNITYVAVGNDPLSKEYSGIYLQSTLPALKNIQKALDEAGLGNKIKVTTPLNEDVYDWLELEPPSQSTFRKEIKNNVVEIVRWFDTNQSPFVVNINPFRSYQNLNLSEHAFFNFTPDGKPILSDRNASYNNIFDLSIDKLARSLEAAGVPNLKIVVGEIGWPTDGNINANKNLSRNFYAGFLKKLGSEEGTPLRPGPMEIYLSSLLDEDMRSIAQGNHERHWGIFRFDGQAKFPMDLSGQGRGDIWPVSVEKPKYLSPSWCIYNIISETTDPKVIDETIDYICKAADCTALTYGSSCNNLGTLQANLSYMFNMYYQMYDQVPLSCNFNGMGTFSFMTPNTSTCFFPVQLDSSAGQRVALGRSGIVVGVLAMVLFVLLSKDV